LAQDHSAMNPVLWIVSIGSHLLAYGLTGVVKLGLA
jgi:hypothetical protein